MTICFLYSKISLLYLTTVHVPLSLMTLLMFIIVQVKYKLQVKVFLLVVCLRVSAWCRSSENPRKHRDGLQSEIYKILVIVDIGSFF